MSIIELQGNFSEYFNGLENSKLKIQKCKTCGKYVFYPRQSCPYDMGELEYVEAGGKGKILTFTVVEKTTNPKLVHETPFVVAVVELEEGPTMLTRIVDAPPESVTFDQEVEVVFRKDSDGQVFPYFKPVMP